MNHYSLWRDETENEGLYEITADGCCYCMGDRVEPGECAWDGTVNYHGEAKSLWHIVDNDNCYVTSEWRKPVTCNTH